MPAKVRASIPFLNYGDNMSKKTFSLADFNTKAAADVPYELEMTYADEPVGLVLNVIGAHSDKVMGYESEKMDKLTLDAISRKQKKITTEDRFASLRESAAVRVVGWNLKDEFTQENLLTLFERNPDFASQVIDASGERKNFTQGLAKN